MDRAACRAYNLVAFQELLRYSTGSSVPGIQAVGFNNSAVGNVAGVSPCQLPRIWTLKGLNACHC